MKKCNKSMYGCDTDDCEGKVVCTFKRTNNLCHDEYHFACKSCGPKWKTSNDLILLTEEEYKTYLVMNS